MVTQLSKEQYLEEILEENSIYLLMQENINFPLEKTKKLLFILVEGVIREVLCSVH